MSFSPDPEADRPRHGEQRYTVHRTLSSLSATGLTSDEASLVPLGLLSQEVLHAESAQRVSPRARVRQAA